MQPAYLEDRAVIALSGDEARGFLQGLITNDIEKLVPGGGLYAALLTPQGKILFDFFLAEGEGAILLDCSFAACEALVKRLRLYKLRARVQIEPRDQLGVYLDLAGHPENRPADYAARAVTFADPRLAALGMRSIASRDEMPARLAGIAAYHARRLTLGVPEAQDFGSDKIFALDAGLEELHGVSFEKGCYVGQELTARMKHRATARKRLLVIETAQGRTLPAPGTAITQGTQALGEVASSYDARGFALIRLDRLGDAPEAMAGDVPVRIVKPQWLNL
jgi:folate-binding protein YgfZ